MKKESTGSQSDALRAEYDLNHLQGGVRGKYFQDANSGTNLVLIDQDLAKLFPNSETVNRALRVVAEAAQKLTPATLKIQPFRKKSVRGRNNQVVSPKP